MDVIRFKRGQIWWCKVEFSDTNIDKVRPVIIVSNDLQNAYSTRLLIIPCTTVLKRQDLPTHIRFQLNSSESMACSEDIMSINKSNFQNYIGMCSEELLQRIDDTLKIALNLGNDAIFRQNLVSAELCQSTEDDLNVDNTIAECEEPTVKTTRQRLSKEEKLRFLQDAETHTIEFMVKKYKLNSRADVAKRKYQYRKQLGEEV